MTIRGLIFQASLISRRQLHVLSRSTTNIKPASPTPLELKTYDLPCHDRRFTQKLFIQDTFRATQISFPEKHWITREIVFHNSNIAQLKADYEKENKLRGAIDDHNYTRNELVTALLYRCAVLVANATSNSGAYPKSVLFQAVNMRPLIAPPLPKTSVGNLFIFSDIPSSTMNETKLSSLLGRVRKGKMQLKGVGSLNGKEFMPLMNKYAKVNQKIYLISSISNFQAYEEMNFGWGRPVKANVVDAPFVNCFFMMDTPNKDGITATVSLDEQDMKNFLVDKDILTYASF